MLDLLFSAFQFQVPDFLMTAAAVGAVICGIVLMGGRSVLRFPLSFVAGFRSRTLRREPALCTAEAVQKEDVQAAQSPFQRIA
jgi:hypothetical protein